VERELDVIQGANTELLRVPLKTLDNRRGQEAPSPDGGDDCTEGRRNGQAKVTEEILILAADDGREVGGLLGEARAARGTPMVSRSGMASQDGTYASVWRGCRWRRGAFGLSILALALIGLNGHLYRLPMTRQHVGWLMPAAFLSLVLSGVLLRTWRCPRCRKPFFGRYFGAIRCIHCDLPKYAAGP
jgi:hypothetical protein